MRSSVFMQTRVELHAGNGLRVARQAPVRQTGSVLRALAVGAVAAVAVGMGGTGTADSLWPDGSVYESWPTFVRLPLQESGGGGVAGWNGSFRRCLPVERVALDFACEYADADGRVGYACVAPRRPGTRIVATAINARVAPGDPTYGAAAPAKVCVAALAYALSLG
jgi:hypothetical protein